MIVDIKESMQKQNVESNNRNKRRCHSKYSLSSLSADFEPQKEVVSCKTRELQEASRLFQPSGVSADPLPPALEPYDSACSHLFGLIQEQCSEKTIAPRVRSGPSSR